ncbi:divalent-cation tolerance protein CutA [Spongiactinospora rosea]|uniref:Divalent-cation tolerance protein CutA n=1 Tax=Spongiactinospora rosea TaxID=2248750 RepID=A0A366M686_9ACTN|nr:divalent-cation tolerance protein CutA [Spongiactinospora rosea]RBQ21716.1 divalent-cation tolerance protein CutA [Spongiactinospora rosea]
MAGYVQVLTTVDDEEKGVALAQGIVEARLAACVQVVGPITSVYRWEGAVEQAREWQLLIKTTCDRFGELEAYIKANHGYDTPEIIATPIVAGSAEYLSWIGAETR